MFNQKSAKVRALSIACFMIMQCTTLSLAQGTTVLVGSGSNLPNPLYKAWLEEYNKRDPHLQVRYLSVGTSQSIKEISTGLGDFGGGEVPLTDEEIKRAKSPIIHLPTVLVGIVPIYNLSEVHQSLRFTGPVLAKIFMGTIKSWNDPQIAVINPGVQLPNAPITVVHRTEGKGSSYIFSDYLSKVSPEFHSKVGRSPSPKWPVGTGAFRNEDVVDQVQKSPGAIGYVELKYAEGGNTQFGAVQNSSGQFVKGSTQSIAAAAHSKANSIPEDFRVSITNVAGNNAYPISSFTWLYVPKGETGSKRNAAMHDFLNWVFTEGQKSAAKNGYVPLPGSVLTKAKAKAEGLK